MNDLRETQDKTQYRFVYRQTRNEKLALWGSMLICVLAMAVLFCTKKDWPFQLFFGVQTGVLAFSFIVRQSLLIDPEGVRQQWRTGSFAFSRHLAWQDVEKIHLGHSVLMSITHTPTGLRCFWFFGPWGRLRRQLMFIQHGTQVYVGEGHSLSLLQAIEKFHAVTQSPQDEEEIARRQTEATNIGGKKVSIVAYTAVALMLFLVLFLTLGAGWWG
ncbi:MAG: hypothetical protein LBB76_06670 [Azoarcus sp.]|jgi:hypothetical protein|nr:hypothetical protein [Azoarcus sp.]